jgi:hypothetical protein
MLKPLLDGIICALHLHLEDGTTDECCARLGRATGRDTKEIRLLLCNRPSWTPLGATRLLHPFGRGVQWNPSDHLCAAAVVELDAHDHSDWIVTTEAYADAALTPAKQLDATP